VPDNAAQTIAALKFQAAFRGRQVRNELELNGHNVRGRGSLTHGGVPPLPKKESTADLEARQLLEPSSAEYRTVSTYFLDRLNPSEKVRARIAMIEKLNVPDIQAQYELILKQMVRREKKRMKAERPALDVDKIEYKWGFHACAAEVVENIISGGFNRSYAGKNATFYGPGCYFARDASYSARNTYSPPDAQGMKRIFLCRLALGAHVKVDYGYSGKEPPVRDDTRLLGVGTLQYDTTTDGRMDDKGIAQVMVAFKDNQAIPEYLVTFSWTS